MTKTILIPTDFSIESLNLFKHAAQEYQNESINVVFFHSIYTPFSITDLLFFSKRELIRELSTSDFHDACEIIAKKFESKIHSRRIEIFTGQNQQAFEQFLEANQVSEILIPKEYSFKLTDKRSVDPSAFIRKSKVPVKEVHWPQASGAPEKNMLAELFLQSN